MKKLNKKLIFLVPVGAFFLITGLYLINVISMGAGILLALFLTLLVLLELGYLLGKMQRSISEKQFRKIETLLSVYQSLNTATAPLPDIRGWSASPDFLKFLLKILHEEKPKIIVELGSGISTFIAGYVCKQLQQGRLYSLEHQQTYATKINQSLALHELQEIVTIIHAPLKKQTFNGVLVEWYDISALADIKEIDLLIVDGPPGHLCNMARYPTVPALYEKLSKNAVVILDDGGRKDERRIAKRWAEERPDLKPDYLPLEKGLFVFYRQSQLPKL